MLYTELLKNDFLSDLFTEDEIKMLHTADYLEQNEISYDDTFTPESIRRRTAYLEYMYEAWKLRARVIAGAMEQLI